MQVMTETFERALRAETDTKDGFEPAIPVRLNRQLREKVASLAGLRGMAREDPLRLSQAINTLIEKF